MSSISGSDELFNTALNLLMSDVKVYNPVSIQTSVVMSTLLQQERNKAMLARNAKDEKEIVEGSFLKKLCDLPIGSDFIAIQNNSNQMHTFSKYMYEHGEIPFLYVCDFDEADNSRAIIIFSRSDMGIVNSALRASGTVKIEAADCLYIDMDIIQRIRQEYNVFVEENQFQTNRENDVLKSKANDIKNIKGISENYSVHILEVEKILNQARDVLDNIKSPADLFEVRTGLDFIQHLVESQQIIDSDTKLGLSSLPMNSKDENKMPMPTDKTNKSLQGLRSTLISDNLFSPVVTRLPYVKKKSIPYDYVLDPSIFPKDLTSKFQTFDSGRKKFLGINKDDIPKFVSSVIETRDSSLNKGVVINHIIRGDKALFSHEYGIFQITTNTSDRKPYEVRLKEAAQITSGAEPNKSMRKEAIEHFSM